MKMKTLAAMALAGALATGPAMAELVMPDLSYRTGPYAAGGTPFSDGYQDYLNLLNARDGGIGGESIRIVECETGYNTEKGVECYESTKGEGALIYQPLSTGITYQLIPKATADGIPIHTMGYGRTSAANGEVFNWVFNYPANYWDAASVAINYLLDENGGDLNGKKIALVYHNSAYGKEPIRTLEELSSMHGFELSQLAVDHPGQEQKSQWLQIRRERPDYVLMWGWGVMNQVAVQEAANINFPMENFIGNWWAGAEHDVTPAGAAANGYKSLNMNRVQDYPVLEEIKTLVHDAGNAAGDGSNIGKVLYVRGMYAAMLAAEAIAKAQDIHGTAAVTPAMVRDGMEALEITNARMTELGMEGIGPEFSVSCQNHGGAGQGLVQQWNAADGVWEPLTDFIAPDASVIAPLIAEDSAAFAAESGITPGCL
ncbi:ABC transporter substrate-binding protein [Yoonia sediminilitoris]|uniref:Amino acid/amide ABC transporter substrate-binding protein (HAAT family) n=1 Tax=Yoonia sediminilitoris TaxID=1286148 RepID=A0A2T6K8K1_9RHOB|nr:ABC transporter substrate-binding protein [Yoonia sediminilitoris]PUB11043.1 amino acid/amide ABC transporter substrate-binding protein (HAAT family) [Yoonia sediminilitoris]RCW90962.1 amino acid/amide ABC transporter substrate-binding protein (HAAT family) [Yoonia sediminilitoris]